MKTFIRLSEAHVDSKPLPSLFLIPLVSNHREVKDEAVLSCWMG